jgi:hypothetical protein
VAVVVIILLLFAWLAIMQSRLNRISTQYRRLLPTGRGNLEEILERQLTGLEQTNLKMETVMEAVDRAERKYNCAVQKVGIMRFNPFAAGDTGGDQSFSVALLNGENSGIVLTSIYTRAQCRVYAKPVENGQSRYQLSTEEEEAIQLALRSPVRNGVRKPSSLAAE